MCITLFELSPTAVLGGGTHYFLGNGVKMFGDLTPKLGEMIPTLPNLFFFPNGSKKNNQLVILWNLTIPASCWVGFSRILPIEVVTNSFRGTNMIL